ncbi:MAG: hypothetical protein HYY41_06380 [Chloroflexi bacterium]|nr:hypothetical protein [Chloroflexota bacterium]
MDEQQMWHQLENAIKLRSTEDQISWSIFGIFWAANAILLVAVFQNGTVPHGTAGIIIALVGFGLSFVWHKIQNRALNYVIFYEAVIEKLERALKIEGEYAVSGKISGEAWETIIGRGIRVRQWMRGSTWVVMILWGIALAVFFVTLIVKLLFV